MNTVCVPVSVEGGCRTFGLIGQPFRASLDYLTDGLDGDGLETKAHLLKAKFGFCLTRIQKYSIHTNIKTQTQQDRESCSELSPQAPR